MRQYIIAIAVACLAIFPHSALAERPARPAQYKVEEAPRYVIGQVIIIGNEITQDAVIRKVIDLSPGQELSYPAIRLAERDLTRLGIFENDPETGVRPTITIIDGPAGSDYKDLLVQVKEARTGSLTISPGINSRGQLVLSLVVGERNFDPFNIPTSLDALREGRAFRGAGQNVRVNLVQVPILPISVPLFSAVDNLVSPIWGTPVFDLMKCWERRR
jgi:outer membrane protein assembly factor BamA